MDIEQTFRDAVLQQLPHDPRTGCTFGNGPQATCSPLSTTGGVGSSPRCLLQVHRSNTLILNRAMRTWETASGRRSWSVVASVVRKLGTKT